MTVPLKMAYETGILGCGARSRNAESTDIFSEDQVYVADDIHLAEIRKADHRDAIFERIN